MNPWIENLPGIVIFGTIALAGIASLIFRIQEWREERKHKWSYRNPANRTCLVCGRHEEQMCNSWDFARKGLAARSWWEVFNPGDATKHPEHAKAQ